MNRKSDEPCHPATGGQILFQETREYGLTYCLYRRAAAYSADDPASLWQYDLRILQQPTAAGAGETAEDEIELWDISRSLEDAKQIFRLFSDGLVMPCNAVEVMEELLSGESLPALVLP